MKIVVLAQGKLKDRGLRELVDDYLSRIRHYARCDEVETKDSEGLVRAVPRDATLIALEVDGEQVSSSDLALRIERWGGQGKGLIAFAIGGAEGLPAELSKRADARMSLSRLTLPHRLARLILVEQIYRALTILRGEPYARES